MRLPAGFRPASTLALLGLALALSGCDDATGTTGPAPLFLSAVPEEGALGVDVFAQVVVTFDRELAPASLENGIRLLNQSNPVQGRVAVRGGNTLVLEPTDPLDFGTTYRVQLTDAVRAKGGKSLSDQRSWEFVTMGDSPPAPDLDSLRSTLEILAHDSMNGRGSGTPDEMRAAVIVQDRFQAYGLTSPGVGWLQPFVGWSSKLSSDVSSQNVRGIIPGSGTLAREWIVVGAHYDHLGIRDGSDGPPGLYNGADDNGSGTVVVMELARIFGDYVASGGMPVPDRRSVLFAAFGAEEVGLLGSCYLAETEMVAPMNRTHAMINYDMVGRVRNRVMEVRGLDTGAGWGPLLANANQTDLVLYAPPTYCTACSDHACFRNRGVPTMWFFSGTHLEYHTPADDVELINFTGLRDLTELSLRSLVRLAIMEGSVE